MKGHNIEFIGLYRKLFVIMPYFLSGGLSATPLLQLS